MKYIFNRLIFNSIQDICQYITDNGNSEQGRFELAMFDTNTFDYNPTEKEWNKAFIKHFNIQVVKEIKMINTVQLTKEEELKCDLLFDVLTSEVEYCFNLSYRNDLTFKERIESFQEYFKYVSQAPIEQILGDYDDDYFSDEIQIKKQELQSNHLKIRFLNHGVQLVGYGFISYSNAYLYDNFVYIFQQYGFRNFIDELCTNITIKDNDFANEIKNLIN